MNERKSVNVRKNNDSSLIFLLFCVLRQSWICRTRADFELKKGGVLLLGGMLLLGTIQYVRAQLEQLTDEADSFFSFYGILRIFLAKLFSTF